MFSISQKEPFIHSFNKNSPSSNYLPNIPPSAWDTMNIFNILEDTLWNRQPGPLATPVTCTVFSYLSGYYAVSLKGPSLILIQTLSPPQSFSDHKQKLAFQQAEDPFSVSVLCEQTMPLNYLQISHNAQDSVLHTQVFKKYLLNEQSLKHSKDYLVNTN